MGCIPHMFYASCDQERFVPATPQLLDPGFAGLSVDDLLVDNLEDPCRIRIRLHHSKMDPFRGGVDIFLPRTKDNLCPVAALLA